MSLIVCKQILSPMEAGKLCPISGYASTHLTKYVPTQSTCLSSGMQPLGQVG